MKISKVNNLIAALVALALGLLAVTLTWAQSAPAITEYEHPGLSKGTMSDNFFGGTLGNPPDMAACLAAARVRAQQRQASGDLLRSLVSGRVQVQIKCAVETVRVFEWVPAPPPVVVPPVVVPPAPTTPGLGRLPANPRLSSGYSTERVSATSEVAGPSNDGTGDFRTRCEPSHYAFEDPIVFPGGVNRSHLHVFFGNTGVNVNSTTTSLLAGGNSTCRGGTVNRSSYWVPAIIDTTTGLPVNPAESDFYYKSGYRGVAPGTIQAMPQGLRMIAGDSMNKTPDGAAYGTVYNWVCHNSGINRGPTIPASCPAGDLLELSVFFPQCWNGELDSPDHKSHMAYGTGSGCPASHPTPLPEVSFHVLWPVPADGRLSTWRLSSDTYEGPAGYSAHGDWFNGWKKDVSDSWSTNCVRAGRDCHSHLVGDGRAIF